MATRAFAPSEAVMISADKIAGCQLRGNIWYIPDRVALELTHIELDSLLYALGQRIGVEDFAIDPVDGGFQLTPNSGPALIRFKVVHPAVPPTSASPP